MLTEYTTALEGHHQPQQEGPLADEEEIFAEASPLLLGKVFETKMKGHLESLKCLAAPEAKEKDYRRGHSHYQSRGGGGGGGGQRRRGGQSNYGGGGGGNQRRFHPYKNHGKGLSEKEQEQPVAKRLCSSCMPALHSCFIFNTIPIVHVLPEVAEFYWG